MHLILACGAASDRSQPRDDPLWWNRFRPLFAGEVRQRRVGYMRGFRQWRRHLDEMFMKINGETHYLWRAVDHQGEILESYIAKTRDKKAALAFMKKNLRRNGSPEQITTDGLRSYKAAMRELGDDDRQEIGRHANNRAENSHLPFRRRERAMLRFRRMKTLRGLTPCEYVAHIWTENLDRFKIDPYRHTSGLNT